MSQETSPVARISDVRRRVKDAFRELDSALNAAGPLIADRAPSVSPWSALDVGEHVTLANHYLLMLTEKCARKSARKLARGNLSDREGGRLDRLESLASREFRWDAPEHMLPTGQASLDTVRANLVEQRDQALSLLDLLPAGEGSHHSIRMLVIGPDARLDLYELLAFIALHARRHAAQVRRISEAVRADTLR
jgi:hypothetical protein